MTGQGDRLDADALFGLQVAECRRTRVGQMLDNCGTNAIQAPWVTGTGDGQMPDKRRTNGIARVEVGSLYRRRSEF